MSQRDWLMQGYQDTAGLWRWRLRAPNGRIVADSGESYSKRSNLTRAVRKFLSLLGVHTYVDVEYQEPAISRRPAKRA